MVDIFADAEAQDIVVRHEKLDWEAEFCDVFGGPVEVRYEGKPLLKNYRFYVDDLDNHYAVTKKQRRFHRGGSAVVTSEGYFPFGSELSFSQTCRFAMNYFRITFDLRWLRGTLVKRHFGLGCLELPGKFVRYWCLPAALHQVEGKQAEWIELPVASDEKVMVGHWHRPPLALVFERDDGVLIEVGTGSDLWRWEENLGAGPETGSYKIFLTQEGITYSREPLMTCTPFTPDARPYRFTSHIAWGKKQDLVVRNFENTSKITFSQNLEPQIAEVPQDKNICYEVDFSAIKWNEAALHVHPVLPEMKMETTSTPCWEDDLVQKSARRLIRKLQKMSDFQTATLVITGVDLACCWNSSHLERGKNATLLHWDINAFLDFVVWLKQQLGLNWQVEVKTKTEMPLISLAGIRNPLGFSLAEVIE